MPSGFLSCDFHSSISTIFMAVEWQGFPRRAEVVNTVFNTRKLLKHILSFLPHLDQLRTRAVSQDFQTAIKTASLVRMSMFRKGQPRQCWRLGVPRAALRPAYPPYRIRGIDHKIAQRKAARCVGDGRSFSQPYLPSVPTTLLNFKKHSDCTARTR